MRRCSLFFFTLALLAALPAAAYDLDAYSGRSTKATLADFTPHADAPENRNNKFYSEQYSFNVDPNSDADFWVQLLISNMGIANGRAALQVHVKPAKGKKEKFRQVFDKGTWSYGTKADTLSFELGENRISGDGANWQGHFANDEVTVDWKISSKMAPWRPGGGRVQYGKKDAYYEVTVLVPRGTLEATATFKKTGETISISGPAYGDHSVVNLSPNLQAKKWVKLRRIRGSRTVVFSAFETPEQYEGRWVGWFMVASDSRVEATGINPKLTFGEVEKDAKSGYSVPRSVLLTGGTGLENFQGAIKAVKLRRRTDKLAGLSKLERAVVSKLVKPISFTYKSAFEFQWDKRGKTRSRKGRAYYHFEQLNP